jgi:hypothetical protein
LKGWVANGWGWLGWCRLAVAVEGGKEREGESVGGRDCCIAPHTRTYLLAVEAEEMDVSFMIWMLRIRMIGLLNIL